LTAEIGTPPEAKVITTSGILLVVEVSETWTRTLDSVTKQHEYTGVGIPEYWVLDARRHSLAVFDLHDDGKYEQRLEMRSRTTLPVAGAEVDFDLAALSLLDARDGTGTVQT